MSTKNFCNKIMIVTLVTILLISACGMHPEPVTRQPVKADIKDFLAAAFGWESWEQLEMGQGGPVLFTLSVEDGPDEVVLAFPEKLMVGSVGDKILTSMLDNGGAQVIGEGEAYAARLQSSVYAIQQAFSSNPNAQMYTDVAGKWIAAFLPRSNGTWYMGWVNIQTKSMFQFCQQLQNCGSFVNWKDAEDVINHLKGLGWTPITASQVPAAIRTYFLTRMGFLQSAWFVRLQGVEVTPIILPIGVLLNPESILLPGDVDWGDKPQE
jgi:hypothetical protein